MDLLFLNVYLVTRHYGGREEGGWWYNAGEPLASVPIKTQRERGHDDGCGNCNQARAGKASFCRQGSEDDSEENINELARQLAYPRVWRELSQEERQDFESRAWTQLEAARPEAFHLVPEDPEEQKRRVQELEELFADQNNGNIYSVLGGAEIRVNVEEHAARAWPEQRPHYE